MCQYQCARVPIWNCDNDTHTMLCKCVSAIIALWWHPHLSGDIIISNSPAPVHCTSVSVSHYDDTHTSLLVCQCASVPIWHCDNHIQTLSTTPSVWYYQYNTISVLCSSMTLPVWQWGWHTFCQSCCGTLYNISADVAVFLVQHALRHQCDTHCNIRVVVTTMRLWRWHFN